MLFVLNERHETCTYLASGFKAVANIIDILQLTKKINRIVWLNSCLKSKIFLTHSKLYKYLVINVFLLAFHVA
tara:strand:- start:722 stop:940 length:219 start_codon:yes stop_codon:yes gene_type:complete